jgi:hypothetical protein
MLHKMSGAGLGGTTSPAFAGEGNVKFDWVLCMLQSVCRNPHLEILNIGADMACAPNSLAIVKPFICTRGVLSGACPPNSISGDFHNRKAEFKNFEISKRFHEACNLALKVGYIIQRNHSNQGSCF